MADLHSEARHRGWRLDRFLAEQLPQHSRTRLQELIRAGQVTVAGQVRADPAGRLGGGEAVAIEVGARPGPALEPAAMPLRIVYEDEALAAIDKPAGLVVHPGAGTARAPTLVEGLLGHFDRLAAGFPGGPPRPGIVHRLDRGTSGLLLVAKSDAAHRALAGQFQRREVEKYYLALAHGRFAARQGEINAPIARDRLRRTRMTTRRAAGRAARTAYQVLETLAPGSEQRRSRSYLWLRLYTGRTHQIRVHLASLGHPVVGDRVYGAPAGELDRLFLHAAELRLRHPASGEPLVLRAPLPRELEAYLDRWRRL